MESIQSRDHKQKHWLTFYKEKHIYVLNGEIAPSASDIKLAYPKSPFLLQWDKGQTAEYVLEYFKAWLGLGWPLDQKALLTNAKSASKAKVDDLAIVGSLMHDYAHSKRLGQPFTQWEAVNSSEHYEKIIKRFGEVDKWADQRNKEETVIEAEQIIASVKHNYAGTFDVLVKRNGKVRLQDYKSAKGFYIDQFIQAALYSIALKEWKNIKVDEFEIIRFNDNTEEPASLVISAKRQIAVLEEQALRLRHTRSFQNEWEKKLQKLNRRTKK